MRAQIACYCPPGISLPHSLSHHRAAIAAGRREMEVGRRRQGWVRGESASSLPCVISAQRQARWKRVTREKLEMGKRGRALRVSMHAVHCDSQAAAMKVFPVDESMVARFVRCCYGACVRQTAARNQFKK